MVSGLVQQQDIGWRHQRPCEIEADAPSTGELADQSLSGILSEPESLQQTQGAALCTVSIYIFQLAVQFCTLFKFAASLKVCDAVAQ